MLENTITLSPEEQEGIALLVSLNKGNVTVIYTNIEVGDNKGLVELTYTVKHVPTPTDANLTVRQN